MRTNVNKEILKEMETVLNSLNEINHAQVKKRLEDLTHKISDNINEHFEEYLINEHDFDRMTFNRLQDQDQESILSRYNQRYPND